MNQLTKILTELQQVITQEKSPIVNHSLAKISNQPCNNDQLSTLINALLSEGDLHHSETWAGHMTPAISATSLSGQLLAGLHNGNLLSPQLYPILAAIEQQVITWLCQLFHQQHGHFVTGSSYANLEALWQAKQFQPKSSRIVYASTAVHYSIVKACQILDLELRYIATDDNGQLLIEELDNACQQQSPLAIIATIGTTTSGAIDPLEACINLSKHFDAWCHIDAAWGGALAILSEYESLFNLISQADSVCFDPHKAWQQPKPASVLLYQRPLSPMLSTDSSYLEQTPLNSLPGSRGGELFLPLWLTLMHSGVNSLRHHSQQRLQQATRFSMLLKKQSNWQIYPSNTGIVCFRPKTEIDLTELVHQGIFSQAKINGDKVYRAVFASTNTKADSLITALKSYF